MTPKVLIVDDEEDFLETLAERLKNRGIHVETANNGLKALELVDKEPFHAVFLDFAMPGLDGITTLKLMLQKNPDLLIYLLTGKATLKQGVEAIKLGARDVIEKPAGIEDILKIIHSSESEYTKHLEEKIKNSIKDILTTRGW